MNNLVFLTMFRMIILTPTFLLDYSHKKLLDLRYLLTLTEKDKNKMESMQIEIEEKRKFLHKITTSKIITLLALVYIQFRLDVCEESSCGNENALLAFSIILIVIYIILLVYHASRKV